MRTRDSKRLVIDADVARASGSERATHPRAEHCRDFLNAVLSLSHRMVMTQQKNNLSLGCKTVHHLNPIVNFLLDTTFVVSTASDKKPPSKSTRSYIRDWND